MFVFSAFAVLNRFLIFRLAVFASEDLQVKHGKSQTESDRHETNRSDIFSHMYSVFAVAPLAELENRLFCRHGNSNNRP